MSRGLGEWIVLGSHAQTQAYMNQGANAQYKNADQLFLL
jgi:hypothetical protein